MKYDFFFTWKHWSVVTPDQRDEKYYFKTTLVEPNIFFLPEKQVIYGSIFLHHVEERNMLPQMYEVYELVMDQATKIWVLSFGSKQGLCKVFCYIFGIICLRIFRSGAHWKKCEKSSTMLNIWQKIEENGFLDWSLPSTDYTIT